MNSSLLHKLHARAAKGDQESEGEKETGISSRGGPTKRKAGGENGQKNEEQGGDGHTGRENGDEGDGNGRNRSSLNSSRRNGEDGPKADEGSPCSGKRTTRGQKALVDEMSSANDPDTHLAPKIGHTVIPTPPSLTRLPANHVTLDVVAFPVSQD